MDKTLQESVAFYDPARFAMAFVFLPSQSGNSVAIWRRKINVPESARQKYRTQIEAAVKLLREPGEYVVMVDEYVFGLLSALFRELRLDMLDRLPKNPKITTTTHKPGQLRKPAKMAHAKAASKQNPNAKQKRKWWKFFLS